MFELDVVGVPLVGDGLDADAGQAEIDSESSQIQALTDSPQLGVRRLASSRRASSAGSSPPVRSMVIGGYHSIHACMRSV